MKNTKLGISVGALGALTYLAGLFNGYMVTILLVGYILLFEENVWLRRTAVKAITLMVLCSFFTVALNLIPDVLNFVSGVASVFNGTFNVVKLNQIISVLTSAISLGQKFLVLALSIKALSQGTIVIPFLDKKVSQYLESDR